MNLVRYHVNPDDTPEDIAAFVKRMPPILSKMDGVAVPNPKVPHGVVFTVIDGGATDEL